MIKKYLKFIKERVNESQMDLFKPYIHKKDRSKLEYPFSDEYIENLFIELADEGYSIDIRRGHEEIYTSYYGDVSNLFVNGIKCGDIRTSYGIDLSSSGVKGSVDVTDSLLTIISYFESQDFEVVISDNRNTLNLDDLIIQGGFFINYETGNIEDDIQIDGDLFLHIINKEFDRVTPRDLSDFYNWQPDYKTENSIFIEYKFQDLVSELVTGDYKDRLLDNDYYYEYSSEYKPTTSDLFRYNINVEYEKPILKIVIEEFGIEEALNLIDNKEINSEEELIEFLLKESIYLEKICKYSDTIDELKASYVDLYITSIIDKNYNELKDDFESTTSDLITYTIEKGENKEDLYIVEINVDILEDFDTEFFENYSIRDIFEEWVAKDNTFNLNPNFSDYGDVDHQEFNKIVKSYLK